jgi:cyclase
MVKRRLIATLLVYRGQIVQTRKFARTNPVGYAFTAVDFFNGWAVDEIMVLEISEDRSHRDAFLETVDGLSRRCFVPLSVGGKIVTLDDVRAYTRVGADKVVLNTEAVRNPVLIGEIAGTFGSQCLVVSIDAAPDAVMPSGYRVMIANGREATGLDAVEWARDAQARGAGEIMINSIEHDGDRRGYDLVLVRRLSDAVGVPVIAMGGVGKWDHFVDGIRDGGADAVAAGNIFHYTEHSTKKAKEFMAKAGIDVRASAFYKVDMPRRPKYRAYA